MKRWATLACGGLFAFAFIRLHSISPAVEKMTLPIDPPIPGFRITPAGQPRERALIVHGLAASKDLMRIFAMAVADAGFEVYAIDLPGHGDSPVGFSYDRAKKALENAIDFLGKDTAVIGHSMGAALLLDLAASRVFSTMVLFSPPPIPLGTLHAARLLVVTGRWDIPRINAFIPPVVGDMPQADWWTFPDATHTTPLFNQRQTQEVVQWMRGGPIRVRTAERLFWILVMLGTGTGAGLFWLAPTFARRSAAGRGKAASPLFSSSDGEAWGESSSIVLLYIAAAGLAMVSLRVVVILSWVRLFAFDYLMSFVFVAGLLLWRGRQFHANSSALLTALLASAYVILVLGLLSGSDLIHTQLSDGRWWRFPILAAAGFPLLLFDESVLRAIPSMWRRTGVAILTRILLGAFIVTGASLLNRDAGFLVLITHLVVLFWIGLWFATGLVYSRTGDPASAAIFASLVQGWALAAVAITM